MNLQSSMSAVTSSPGSALKQNECCLVMDVWASGQESMAKALRTHEECAN